jgi:hypothetical protein
VERYIYSTFPRNRAAPLGFGPVETSLEGAVRDFHDADTLPSIYENPQTFLLTLPQISQRQIAEHLYKK